MPVRTCSTCGGAIDEYESRIYEGGSVHHVEGSCVTVQSPTVVAVTIESMKAVVASEPEESVYVPVYLNPAPAIQETREPETDDVFPDEVFSDVDYDADATSAEDADAIPTDIDQDTEIARPMPPKRSHKKKVPVAV